MNDLAQNGRATVMPFCPVCGGEVSEEEEFCAKCGAALKEARAEYAREEKYEKDEKGEKREKKEKSEKTEKREKEGEKIAPITGGLILIYLGITIYFAANNVIDWVDWWSYFLLGLGGILIIQALLVAALTKMRGYGYLIGGAILCLIGASAILGIENWWSLILIAIGLAVIVMALRERRRTPRP